MVNMKMVNKQCSVGDRMSVEEIDSRHSRASQNDGSNPGLISLFTT
ncbi:MAG: hypothetical protein LBJ63_00400 [Prevotellaceae bacterium]|jgi:hypothetical protein|nr:hypothetical protein [Prevotellaceae bacterium]